VIFRRLLFAFVAASVLAAGAGVFVIALAFALHAAVQPLIGPAWADCVVAAAAAVLIGLAGLALAMAGQSKRRRRDRPDQALERALAFVRSRPVSSIVGVAAVGLMAVRNPAYLGAVLRSFVEGREPRR
jgi:membrane protein YqaA with SNARE-associated domain